MSDTVYDNVKKHWESDGHKKLSQINKANCMKEDSLSGPSSHCGGSISTAKRIRKLDNFFQKMKETDNLQECQGKKGLATQQLKRLGVKPMRIQSSSGGVRMEHYTVDDDADDEDDHNEEE
ncbi:hypothetical protein M9H77_22228 [Catharanthus roseus]|uniref:Uncharacterized protein n=1 Tax=Catharanthus roseus TaxID=4058 RepID=A0ACC0APW4_CATRO|nr:hypothetical protein M9H77_22228 [Catharanthus roseus]